MKFFIMVFKLVVDFHLRLPVGWLLLQLSSELRPITIFFASLLPSFRVFIASFSRFHPRCPFFFCFLYRCWLVIILVSTRQKHVRIRLQIFCIFILL